MTSKKIPEYVRRLREHPLIQLPDPEIRTRAYYRWLGRGSPMGSPAEDWLAAELEALAEVADAGFVRPIDPEHPSTEQFEQHYSAIARYRFRLDERGTAVFLGGAAPRACSLCERLTPAATFHEEAHVIPELLGNRWLFTHDECDDCNDAYGRQLENELGAMLLPERAVATTPSKRRGATKLSLNSARSSLGGQPAGDPLRLELKAGDPSITYKLVGDHELVLDVPQPRFKPQSAARALGKMAWHLLPAHSRGKYNEMREWVIGDRVYTRVPFFHLFFPWTRLAELAVALWETRDPRFPRLVAAVFSGNTFLILPLPQVDPYEQVILPVVPRSPAPPYVPIARKRIALSDERTPLGRATFTMNFMSQRMLFAHAPVNVVVQTQNEGAWVDMIRCCLATPPTNTTERSVYQLQDGELAGQCEIVLETAAGATRVDIRANSDYGGRRPGQILATVRFLEAIHSGTAARIVEEEGERCVLLSIPAGTPHAIDTSPLRAAADFAKDLRALEGLLQAELQCPASPDPATLLSISVAAAVARKMPSMPLPGGILEVTRLAGHASPAEIFRVGDSTELRWPFVAELGSRLMIIDGVVVRANEVRANATGNETWTLSYESGEADLTNAVVTLEDVEEGVVRLLNQA